MRIFHIVRPTAWSAAQATGQYTPVGFEADGFVHFSFAHQVARVANAIYRHEPELVVVEVESDACLRSCCGWRAAMSPARRFLTYTDRFQSVPHAASPS